MPTNSNLQHNKYQSYSAYHYRGMLLYWIILFLFFSSLIALPLIKVDVTVQSRGVIKTINKISPISSAISAKVTQSNLSENRTVFQGDTLLILDQSGLDGEIHFAREQIKIFDTYLSDINQLVKDSLPSQVKSPLYRQEYIDFTSGVAKLSRTIEKQRIDFERTSLLYNDGVVPVVSLQEDSFNLKELEDELILLKTRTIAKWEMDNKDYILARHELNTKVENLLQQKSQHIIIAPYDGSIIEFNGIAEGSFINENEVIAMLSPEEELLAECYVSPSDIGLIRKDMPVKLQVDAYNYNEWGLLEGHVAEIGHDVSEINDQFVFVVRNKMHKNHLSLKNGVKGPLKKGMSITGRFIVTQRTLFQLLFDNVNDWLNPKVITQANKK